jgi:adenine-specific DNA methylase
VILTATLDYPARFGKALRPLIEKYGKIIEDEVKKRLATFFPLGKDETVFAYLWARTVHCPYTGKAIPLSPNWWLINGTKPVAVVPVFAANANKARFRIVEGAEACRRADPDKGTIRRGDAISPWAHAQTVSNEYIKAEAQSGRMGAELFAVVVKTSRGFAFRVPSEKDHEAVLLATNELMARVAQWQADGILPVEDLPMDTESWTHGNTPAQYDAKAFSDLFSARQFLALGTIVKVIRETAPSIKAQEGEEMARAILTYLALSMDKAVSYNSKQARWDSTRKKIANTFDRHDFGFKWSYAEFDAAHSLFSWAVSQVVDAYGGLVKLVEAVRSPLFRADGSSPVERLRVTHGSAVALSDTTGSLHLVCVDPPYYDNVMYSELSDFFYVWMKRILSDVYPELFAMPLVDKDAEAVANSGRFAAVAGEKRKELAEQDYEHKMAACFREMHRVLHDEGMLTVMFTHKRVDAWDTLATALITAGFAVETSWPVQTESENSLNQAKKNSAQSTILLVCRKRKETPETVWWDDIRGRVREIAREKAVEFEQQGISGVDLYLSTFGPVLSIISEHWPVLTSGVDDETGQPMPLRPEVALDLARAEVVALRKQGLLLGHAVQFDPITDWYLMAWDTFAAEKFPADEARKLAIVLVLDLERDLVRRKKLLTKKQNFVALQPPNARRLRGMVDPELTSFDSWIDGAHTAMLVYQEDGAAACEQFLRVAKLRNDATFRALLQALINAVPRTKEKGKFVCVEADLLERLRLAFFDDLQGPSDLVPPAPPPEQVSLLGQEEAETEVSVEDDL